MEQAFILGLTGFTSIGAYLVGMRGLGFSGSSLRAAVSRMAVFAGMSIAFFTVNLAIGIAGILIVRSLTSVFLSAYLLNDMSLLAISVLQGLIFECWRARSYSGEADG